MSDLEHFTISIDRRSERYAISYEAGSESVVLGELILMANRIDLDFDWLDAAAMSHQVGQNLSRSLVPLNSK